MQPGETRVFVPAHITGFFSVHRTDEPMASGSRGAGLTLTDGATVEVAVADAPSLTINGEEARLASVETVVSELGARPQITVELDAPLGAGCGLSGAITLGTAVGVNRVFGCDRSENALVRLAHAAEVEAGTGLGDVVAQHRGGAPIRLEPGGPGFGQLDGIPDRRSVEYLTLGSLSTAEVLAGDTSAINRAGGAALAALRETPTLDRFMTLSREFGRDSGLETGRVREVIDEVDAAGGEAAMAMLGQTVFALGTALSDAGYDAERCEIATGGVRIG